MSTGDRNTFGLLGEQIKGTTSTPANRARLKAFLRGLSNLDFSEKGRTNICQRFCVSADELTAEVAAIHCPRPSAPTTELLFTIGAAIGSANKVKGGAGQC